MKNDEVEEQVEKALPCACPPHTHPNGHFATCPALHRPAVLALLERREQEHADTVQLLLNKLADLEDRKHLTGDDITSIQVWWSRLQNERLAGKKPELGPCGRHSKEFWVRRECTVDELFALEANHPPFVGHTGRPQKNDCTDPECPCRKPKGHCTACAQEKDHKGENMEMLKQKELDVVAHMKAGWNDGCQCEPCLAVKQIVDAAPEKAAREQQGKECPYCDGDFEEGCGCWCHKAAPGGAQQQADALIAGAYLACAKLADDFNSADYEIETSIGAEIEKLIPDAARLAQEERIMEAVAAEFRRCMKMYRDDMGKLRAEQSERDEEVSKLVKTIQNVLKNNSCSCWPGCCEHCKLAVDKLEAALVPFL